MTTVVRIFDYAGFVSVELPYNLPPVISVMSLPKAMPAGQLFFTNSPPPMISVLFTPGKTKQAPPVPPKPEQINGALINRLTPGLSLACEHARRLPPAGPDVQLTMVGGTSALLDIVVSIVSRQGMRVSPFFDTSIHLNYSGPLLIFRRQRVGTIAGTLQMVQRSKPASLHSVWS